MHAFYYGYGFRRFRAPREEPLHLTDLRPMLGWLADHGSHLQGKFKHNGHPLFFERVSANVFMLLAAKDEDIVRAVREGGAGSRSIQDMLDEGERVGFAAYVYLEDSLVAVASTAYAPRCGALVTLVDALIATRFGADIVRSAFEPMTNSFNPSYATTLATVKTARLAFPGKSSTAERMLNHAFFGDVQTNLDEVESVEVTIRSKRKQSILPMIGRIATSATVVADASLFEVLAQRNIADAAEDMFLIGEGAIVDLFDPRRDDMAVSLKSAAERNSTLRVKLNEFRDRCEASTGLQPPFSDLASPSSWPADAVLRVPD